MLLRLEAVWNVRSALLLLAFKKKMLLYQIKSALKQDQNFPEMAASYYLVLKLQHQYASVIKPKLVAPASVPNLSINSLNMWTSSDLHPMSSDTLKGSEITGITS